MRIAIQTLERASALGAAIREENGVATAVSFIEGAMKPA